MWPKRNPKQDLRVLLSRIDGTPEPTEALIADILQHACPRLQASLAPNDLVARLIEAEAWIELGLWLIGWELPDWSVHQLSCGDCTWNCSIGVRGLARNWINDIADFQHDSLPLAILGALVDAQLCKLEGRAPSNVTAFRPRRRAAPRLGPVVAWSADRLGFSLGRP